MESNGTFVNATVNGQTLKIFSDHCQPHLLYSEVFDAVIRSEAFKKGTYELMGKVDISIDYAVNLVMPGSQEPKTELPPRTFAEKFFETHIRNEINERIHQNHDDFSKPVRILLQVRQKSEKEYSNIEYWAMQEEGVMKYWVTKDKEQIGKKYDDDHRASYLFNRLMNN